MTEILSASRASAVDADSAALRARIKALEAEIALRDEDARRIAELEERMRFALAGSGIGTWDWNIATNEIQIDERWAGMLGYTLEQLDFKLETWERLIHPEDLERVKADLTAHLEGRTQAYENTHRLLTKQGEYKWVQDRGKVFAWSPTGEPLRAAGTHRDVHQEKLLERQLAELALKDPLTGLPNRRHLRSVFPAAAAHAERTKSVLGVIFIDLDGFKPVNDLLGHEAGDRVLTETAHRLAQIARGGDVVARVGGDEFCILITHARDEAELLEAGHRFRAAIKAPIAAGDDPVCIDGSVGIACFPRHGATLQAIMDAADAAMYGVKNRGKGGVSLAS